MINFTHLFLSTIALMITSVLFVSVILLLWDSYTFNTQTMRTIIWYASSVQLTQPPQSQTLRTTFFKAATPKSSKSRICKYLSCFIYSFNYKLEQIKIASSSSHLVTNYHQYKVNIKCAKCLEIVGETNISKKHQLFSFGQSNSPEDLSEDIIITGDTNMKKFKKYMIDFSQIAMNSAKTLRKERIEHGLQNEYEKFINKEDIEVMSPD